MAGARVSAIVVTWNSAADIANCLAAVSDQQGIELDLIVVDNASSDATADIVREQSGPIRFIENAGNAGYAKASNQARRAATGEFLLLLNPDCIVGEGCVASLADVLVHSGDVGVAAAALRNPDGTPQLFARKFPSLWLSVWCHTEIGSRIDRKFLHSRFRRKRTYADAMEAGIDQPLIVDTAAAACVLLRASEVPDPLFDEQFLLLYNDTDLYRRFAGRGLRTVVIADATATHRYAGSLTQIPWDRHRAENWVSLMRYADRWWPGWSAAALRLVIAFDALACSLMILTRRKSDLAKVGMRAALGSLGLPGGAAPWMTRVGRSRHSAP